VDKVAFRHRRIDTVNLLTIRRAGHACPSQIEALAGGNCVKRNTSLTLDPRRSAALHLRISRWSGVESDNSILAFVVQTLSLSAKVQGYFSSLAINLGLLASPVQEGEMNELFNKRKSSQA
jgi:hypothetical protein